MDDLNISLEDLVGSVTSPSLGFSGLGLIKLVFLLGIGIYLAFAVIVIRQVDFHTRTLHGEFEGILKLVSWLHLVIAIGIFFLALIVL